MKSGIYSILHLSTGRIYVGSAVNLPARWKNHRTLLRAGSHRNAKLQRAWTKYGEAAFAFGVVEECEQDHLLIREQHWIDQAKAATRGFNILPIAGSHLGRKRNAATKEKQSLAAKGNKRGIGNTANLGRKLPESTRQKMSASRLGKRYPGRGNNQLGRKRSAETRARISAAQKGVPKPKVAIALRAYHAKKRAAA